MVLTAAQMTAFFENADQMGVQHAMVVQLAEEGIQSIDDLADFNKEALQQLADNLRRPGGRVPNPDPGAAIGETIPMPAFVFGLKFQKRLGIACELVRYYNTVGRDLTAVSIQCHQEFRDSMEGPQGKEERGHTRSSQDLQVPSHNQMDRGIPGPSPSSTRS